LLERVTQSFAHFQTRTCLECELCQDMVASLSPAAFAVLVADRSRLLVIFFHH
jgi:hypothetical protein